VTQETIQILFGAIVLIALIGVAMLFMRKRRSEGLKDRFGAEYDTLAQRTGDPAKAEALLAKREKRVAAFTFTPLTSDQRDKFVGAWRSIQAQFVDDPQAAVGHADKLLGAVMQARGYPVADFAQRAADLSVDHAEVVQHYRTAHDIALRHERGEAGTEDLRQAMIHYRALFDDLVNEPEPAAADATAVKVEKEKVRDEHPH
jgi:FtsZ-interacting cell division protein ZipA